MNPHKKEIKGCKYVYGGGVEGVIGFIYRT
jgi:hypothetical protein